MVGGQLGIGDAGTVLEDLTEAVEEAFEHVERALRASGVGDDAWEHVYSHTRSRRTTKASLAPWSPSPRKYLKNTKPAWTGVTVKALVFLGLHIEITVQAYLPQ
ncbi:hypothetical protein C8A05DRAFT_34900 [Staphylotrichum tortipilum]|uniref:Uncharacterized protein n=1 Tax=Staphylotrichum tortipilum TaxID=2831512 RepID=A0AAN6RS49_9PEZI|nr:hypothetical protein C8A05DRAFT_34900 [Staphylotrichum longicolle]